MAPRRNSITSDMEESGYDVLSRSDVISDVVSDDDACTDSLSGSTIGDESEGNTASEYRYDSDGSGSGEEEDDGMVVVGDLGGDGPTHSTPSVGPRSDDHEALENDLLGSHLSVLTERPLKTEQSIHLEQAELMGSAEADSNVWRKLKSSEAYEQTMHALESPLGQNIMKLTLVLAVGLISSRLVSPWLAQQEAQHLVPITPYQNTAPTANILPVDSDVAEERNEPAHAKNWPQFEQLQQTLDFLRELTSSQQADSSSSATVDVKSAPSSASSATLSTAKSATKPTPVFVKKQNHTRAKVMEKARYSKDEKFYVFLDTGRVTPFSVGHKLNGKHRFGPFTKITGNDKKFKVEFDSKDGKVKVAHVGSQKFRGSTRIVVSRNGQVLQRGELNSPGATVTWTPARIHPAQLSGNVQVLFALPTEAVFQVSVLELGSPPTRQWSGPPKKAAAAATDVMRRITDAINVYVEPHRHLMPLITPWHKSGNAEDTDTEDSSQSFAIPVTDVLLRAQERAVAIAHSFRTVAIMDIEAANRCLVQANVNIIKTFTRYRGEVIRAARGAPRKSLSKAQDRVKEFRRTMERKFVGQKNEPIGRIRKDEKEVKPVISPWGVLGF